LIGLVPHVHRADGLARAEALVRSLPSPLYRVAALSALAKALAAHNRVAARQLVADAEALAAEVGDPDHQAMVRGDVAEALAAVGDLDGAERVARQISMGFSASGAYAALSRATGSAGDLDRAEAQLAYVRIPGHRVAVLVHLAILARRRGEIVRARRFVDSALADAAGRSPGGPPSVMSARECCGTSLPNWTRAAPST
jgi:hypothetical protein